MKNLVTTFSILLFSLTFAQEEGIKFDQSSFKDLLAKAKKEKKLLFIDAYAVWCGPCKMMDRNVFTQKIVGDYFNKSFISSRIDMEKGEGREIAQKFSVRSYPTYLFLNGDGEMVSQNYGYMEPGLFLSMAQDVNAGNSKGGSLKDRFAKGESSPEFLMNIMKLNSTSDFDFAKKASEKYFAKKKADEPLTKEEAGFLFFFIKSSKDANFKYLVDKKSEIIQFLPEESYNEYKNQILLADIMETAIDTKNNRVDDAKFMAAAEPLVGKEVASKKLNQIKLSYYEQNANYAEYEKTALEYYKNPDLFDQAETLKAAWIFAEHVKDKTSLKKAAEWAEKSVMRGETAENTYILAKIYFMMGNKNLAKSFAEMSNNLAKQTGKDANLSQELLNQIKN